MNCREEAQIRWHKKEGKRTKYFNHEKDSKMERERERGRWRKCEKISGK